MIKINYKFVRKWLFLNALFLLYLTRYVLVGFKYGPILDDYIQYYWYPDAYENIGEVFFGIGTIATRPLAAIADIYFWKYFFSNPVILTFTLSRASFFAVYFLSDTLEQMRIKTGALFYIILLFMPLCIESQYWMSASSRVIVGVLIAGFSMRVFSFYKKKSNVFLLILFCILHFASMCFYEQTAIFSFILCALYFYRTKEKPLMYIIPVANVLVIAIYYIVFKNIGTLGQRFEIFLPQEIISRLVFVLKEMYNVIIEGVFVMNIKSFMRSCEILKQVPWLFLAIMGIAFIAAALYEKRKDDKNNKDRFAYLFGICVIAFSLLPVFIIRSSYLPYRMAFIPLIGAAIIISQIMDKFNISQAKSRILIFLLSFVLSVSCVSEINDYKNTSDTDKLICTNIISKLDEGVLSGEKECYVLLKDRVFVTLNSRHAEHILSVVSSDWALTGAVRYYAKRYVKRIIPVDTINDEILNSSSQIIELCDDFSIKVIRM